MHIAKTKCYSFVYARETVLMYVFIKRLYDPHRYTASSRQHRIQCQSGATCHKMLTARSQIS
jgi:hypothetical protein